MKTPRHQLIAKLHVLIAQQGADKEALYAAYGVTTARDLSDAQLSDMVHKLAAVRTTPSVAPSVPAPQRTVSIVNDTIKKKRSEILALLTKSPKSTNPRTRGLGIPNDWQILNPWIERHAGALLFKLSEAELDGFRKQLLAMRDKGWSYREEPTKPAEAPKTPSAPKPTRRPSIDGAYMVDFTTPPRILS